MENEELPMGYGPWCPKPQGSSEALGRADTIVASSQSSPAEELFRSSGSCGAIVTSTIDT